MPLYGGAVSVPILPLGSTITTTVAAAWPAVNRAVFSRFPVGRPSLIRYVNWVVGTSSGNVQLGIVRLTSSGATATYERVAHTGVIACPSTGDIHTDLGASTVLAAGDYAAFLWADNVTLTARTSTTSGLTPLRFAGTESSLASGVGTTGTITWSTQYVVLGLEP
jgi:hypothetical protein